MTAAPAASALRELPSQRPSQQTDEPVDVSRLRLLKSRMSHSTAAPPAAAPAASGGFGRAAGASRRLEPGAPCEARYSNGEWYGAQITATSRAEDGTATFVVRFDDDGVTMHLPASALRRAA